MKRFIRMGIALRVAALSALLALGAHAAHAQTGKVLFPQSEMTMGKAIEEIERQTQYVFAFDAVTFDPNVRVRLRSTELTVADALAQLLPGNDYDYVVRNRFIAVTPKPKAVPAAAAKETDNDTSWWRSEPSVWTRQAPRNDVPAPQPTPVAAAPAPAYSDYEPLARFAHIQTSLPSVALKTNLLYGAVTLTPNLGLEFGVGRRSTLGISGGYNPWNRIGTLEDNDKLVHWIVRPEYRYWFCERFSGHFIGADIFFSDYNVSGHDIALLSFDKEFRYDGNAFGAGVNYGYHLPLSKRWGVEFTVGVGFAKMHYDKFDCALCSDVIGTFDKTYFGITRAGINLVFMIK